MREGLCVTCVTYAFALLSIAAINDSNDLLNAAKPSASNFAFTASRSTQAALSAFMSASALSIPFSRVKAALP